MSYRNKVYVSFDADNDIMYYRLMEAWKQNDNIPFNFLNAHDINRNYDKSEESIKASLRERFDNSKIFVLLLGAHTKYLYKYVRREIEQAIKRKLPIIIVNINGKRTFDSALCPKLLDVVPTISISFNAKILQYALDNWPESFEKHLKNDEISHYYYSSKIYDKLNL